MALRDLEYQKSNKLAFWCMAFTIFLAQALIFSGFQASSVTLVWRVLVFLTHQILVEFSKVSGSGPTNMCWRYIPCTTPLLEKWSLSFNHPKCKTTLRNLSKCMPKQVAYPWIYSDTSQIFQPPPQLLKSTQGQISHSLSCNCSCCPSKKGNRSPHPLHPQHVSHAPCLSLESKESPEHR